METTTVGQGLIPAEFMERRIQMPKYILGVDGGNSKTDYLLCTADGAFVDVYRTKTCSHEQFKNGYDGMEHAMGEQLAELFKRNGIGVGDIAAAGMGLAGADLPSQIAHLKQRVSKLGFSLFEVANDGILGVKGACEGGVGVCAVNGSGTVILGIDGAGTALQVGGIGPMSGDEAGGYYIARQIIAAWYAYLYRCGDFSVMYDGLAKLFGGRSDDLPGIISDYGLLSENQKSIINIGDEAAQSGDKTAMEIFDNVGAAVGRGAAGCIKRLAFDDRGSAQKPLDVVMVGSIWHKVNYKGMRQSFERTVYEKSGKVCRYISLEAPPAVGGVLWAKELLDGAGALGGFRRSLLGFLTLDKYEGLVFGK
jgi:N-acetylglucosamine kinase-like BadF-type ATPase